jgi:predicted PhzF superfamily epimerase YddE/YHI9
MRIQHIDINYVNQVWQQVAYFIEVALEYQDDYTLEHAQVYVSNGTWTLFVAVDDEGELITGHETYAQFTDLLKAFGATYIECASRESATRLWQRFGLKEKYRVAGAKL